VTRKKGTAAHYRQRIDRLRRRAAYLRSLLASGERSEGSVHHITAEISALEWAVATLAPWFETDELPPTVDAVNPVVKGSQ
jgi:hypothetical protein